MSDKPAPYSGGGKPDRNTQRTPTPTTTTPQTPGLAKVMREIKALAPPGSTVVFIPMYCRRGGKVTAVFLVRREGGGGEPVNELFTSLPYKYYEEAVRTQQAGGGSGSGGGGGGGGGGHVPPQTAVRRPQPAAAVPHAANTLRLWGQFPINPKYRCGRCGATSYLKCSCGALNCWDGETRQVTCGSCGANATVTGYFESIEGGVRGKIPSGGSGGGGMGQPQTGLPRPSGGGNSDRPALPHH